ARGRCECCGAHEHQRALEVDHIVPKNQGGSDDLSNLQALCFRCNAGKRDTDFTVATACRPAAGAAGERTGAVHRRCLPGDAGPQPGDPAAPCCRRNGAAPAGVELRGGAAEAAAGAAECPGRVDQRLECGAELRGSGVEDGVSCALASDSEA
ncbi:MAG: HNH endonuclease, partial [Betaproteobacteria bacterium]|nr:HNH endonuclease [Betaproteobacteria bacterium]